MIVRSLAAGVKYYYDRCGIYVSCAGHQVMHSSLQLSTSTFYSVAELPDYYFYKCKKRQFIHTVVSIICMFLFREFGLTYSRLRNCFLGYDPLNGEPYQRNPKSTSLRESTSFEPS